MSIQKNRFLKIKKMFNLPNCKFSLAASGGIFLGKEYHFDMVRPGIALYGGKLFFQKELKNVVSLISPVIQINRLKKGETAGYNQSYKAKKDIVTATIPLGYADGVKIRISNIGYVFYKNVKLPMIARISMDLMIVDVTKVKNIIKIGDYLEVFGKNLNLDSFAKVSQTSPYDIITSVSERCERVYIKLKMNFINQIYKKLLEKPKFILFLLVLVFSFSVYNAKNFQLDASADSLLLENDPDLNYLRSVNERYSSEEFFVITYSPKKKINEESLKELRKFVDEIDNIKWVSKSISVLNAPLFESSDLPLIEKIKNIR